MPISTVNRERLIPRLHMLSIATVIIVAFAVLLPSAETFIYSPEQVEDKQSSVDELDLAYLLARNSTGDLSDKEIHSVIHDMIRNKNWQEVRTLISKRPDLTLDPLDQYLLKLETASAGFYAAESEASSASYKANLVKLMTDMFDNPALHDQDTLERSAALSADLGQPALASRYYKLIAENFPLIAAENYASCGLVLRNFNVYGGSVDCFEAAIASATEPTTEHKMRLHLARLHTRFKQTDRAVSTLESLLQELSSDKATLERTASFALEIERPDIAYPLYAKLADVEGERAIFWLEKAAKWAEASNQPGIAAEYVLTVSDLSDEKYQPELVRRRQKLLIASGRNDEALATIYQQIAANPDSGEELINGVTFATRLGMTQQALEWNEALLQIRPFDIDAMARQIDLSLASNRQEDALSWTKKLLEQDPNSDIYQRRLAQLLEWTGDVDGAMKQRQLIASRYPSLDNDRELLRLAILNWDSNTAAETLRRIGSSKPLSTEELMQLVDLYEQNGTPELAAAAITEMLGENNDAELLRELASLYVRHANYEEALTTWEQFADRFGRSGEESLNRMELLWRLKRPVDAVAVAEHIDQFNSSSATEYQLLLAMELGWRYKKPDLVLASAPHLDQLNKEKYGFTANNRIFQSLVDKKDYQQAIQTAENIWRQTDDKSFLVSAVKLALSENIYPHYERYLDATGNLISIREIPEYWLTVAEHYNKKSDTVSAIETYQNLLTIQPENAEALGNMIWTMLGTDTDENTILQTLNQHDSLATKTPDLWNAYAIGYLQVNQPETSLRWFSKLVTRGDHDYNMLLSFADALEHTGNETHAYKVRTYALQELLPQILASADNEINSIGRDYINVLRSYGGAAENEIWTQKLLDDIDDASPLERAWRRELAASWYLATQRNDYARVLMTKTHERRLESPAWQRLAVALGENNQPVVREILASSRSQLTSGDEILALRKLGFERQAYNLAKNTIAKTNRASERKIAYEHLISLRGSRPGFYSGQLTQRQLGRLDINESSLALRHTLSAADIGFELNYKRNNLRSDSLSIANANEDDLAVSAHFGNSARGGQLTTGINSNGDDDLNYTSGSYHVRNADARRELVSEIGINEVADNSAEFRLDAKRDRAELRFETGFGNREFVRVSGSVNDLADRTTNERIALGYGAGIELGTTGTVGSNNWSMGISASGEINDREPESNLSNLLFDDTQQVSLNASWVRGGIRTDYPSTTGLRYSVSARLGHTWPTNTSAVSVAAGAGFRVLGNDEVSFQLQHDRNTQELTSGTENFSTFGIQYTNHFK